jgi:hypothetical protein
LAKGAFITAFRTEDDLRRALNCAGLAAFADVIVATCRPALIFVRRQRLDDALPGGTSKMFGLPDLPPGVPWPHRPPVRDAAARARKLREERIRSRVRLREAEWESEWGAKKDHCVELTVASFDRNFPLAFLAQLDLEALSREPGFDADLPRHGILSLFEDLTMDDHTGSIHVYWFDVPAAALARRAPPPELVTLSDARDYPPWAEQTMAEVLEPHSTLTVPFHWLSAAGAHWSEMYDFLHDSSLEHTPAAEES